MSNCWKGYAYGINLSKEGTYNNFFGAVKLKVEEVNREGGCTNCALRHTYICGSVDEFIGSCFSSLREDGKDVAFIKVEN